MSSNNPYAPPTGSEPALPEENVEAVHRVPHNAPVPVESSAEGSDPAFPYGVPTPHTEEEKPDADLPPHISEAHADSEPTAPTPREASSSTAAQRDRSSSPTAGRPHATSTGSDPQDSRTREDKSTKAFTLPIRTDVFAGLAVVIAALFFTSITMAQAADFGTGKLQWQFATCVFGLAAAGLCIPFVPAAVRYARILFTERVGRNSGVRVCPHLPRRTCRRSHRDQQRGTRSTRPQRRTPGQDSRLVLLRPKSGEELTNKHHPEQLSERIQDDTRRQEQACPRHQNRKTG